MIFDRLYEAGKKQLLYHYCDKASFEGILASRSIWASAFDTLNDPAERQWGYDIFKEACGQLAVTADSSFIKEVTSIVDMATSRSKLMVCSLSLHPDSPNQWCRYGDAGRGFAIGFSANTLRMPAKALRILYDREAQIFELVGNLRHVFEYEQSLGFKYGTGFQDHCFQLGLDLCAYKNPAYQDEGEIRYAHIAYQASSKIVARGARAQDGTILSEPCTINYRMRGDTAIPYVALDWSDKGKALPIKVATLGPKNLETEQQTKFFLSSIGLTNVSVGRSKLAG